MSIQAKISSASQNVASSQVVELPPEGLITLTESSNVALNVPPADVVGYSKNGSDLIIQLKSGEKIRIANFYVEDQAPSQLFLVEEEKLIAVDLVPSASDGVVAASYTPQETLAGFESLTSDDSGIGLGALLLTAGTLAAGGAALSGGSGGGSSGGASGQPSGAPIGSRDNSPPNAASDLKVAPDGSSITGKAEPGASVGIDTNGDGKPDVTVVAGPDGSFESPLVPPLTNGETITVIVTDPSGNDSPPAVVTAPDITAPDPAGNVQVSPDGTTVTGTAEPGANVEIDTNGDGEPDVTVVANPDGTFSGTLNPPLTNGETVTVVVTDPAGNSSPPTTATAPDSTPPAAAGNVQVSPDGTTVTGTAEPGANVEIDTNGDGEPDVTVVANPDGTFSGTLNPPLTNGETVTVVVTDPAGNSSPPTTATAPDSTPPAAAGNVQVSPDGTTVTGTAEPGANVEIDTNGDGEPDVTVVANPDGTFSGTLNPPLTNGETVTVVVTDPAGNSSPPTTATAPDSTPPAAAGNVQISSDGSTVTGTAEPGADVEIDTNGDGQPDLTVVANPDGTFSGSLTPPLTDGETVTVVVRDPAGNSSTPVTVIAPDFPAAPVVNPSDGKGVSGTAEAGVEIIIRDAGGTQIGSATADGNGDWSTTLGTPVPDGTVLTVHALDSNNNKSPDVTVVVDGIAPPAPDVEPSNGSVIQGTAEPGSTVTLTLAGGAVLGSVIVGADGKWSVTPVTPPLHAEVVNAVASDAAGNESSPASVTIDAQAPDAPILKASNGMMIEGTAEAGSTVIITLADGTPVGETVAAGDGSWSFTPSNPLPHDADVKVVAKDAVGNTSAAANLTVDAEAPLAPVIQPTDGKTVSGTGEEGATILIKDSAGNTMGQTTVSSGVWSYDFDPDLSHGTLIQVQAVDAAGNTSDPAAATVDTQAPPAPVIHPSNGEELSGTGEPGAIIALSLDGTPIGEVTVAANGAWSFDPAAQVPPVTLPHNGTVTAVPRDAAGNVGSSSSVVIDSEAPLIPTVNPSNGTSLSGTAEPESTVVIRSAGGTEIGTANVGSDGNWSWTPSPALAHDTVVTVEARDATGNTGPTASVTIDSEEPAAPVILPSDGNAVSGTAEPGTTVTLTDINGTDLGTVSVGADGNWSIDFNPRLDHDLVVIATATDPTGNVSDTSAVMVDAIAPNTPTVLPSNGSSLSGTAEPGSTVVIYDSNDVELGTVVVGGDGTWSMSPVPGPALNHGDTLKVVARDAAGNTSPEAPVTIDAEAPLQPVVSPSNGSLLTGTASEGNLEIEITVDGNIVATVMTDGAGNWEYAPATPLTTGQVVTVTATDAAGNTSQPSAPMTVDADLPTTPHINPSNGTVISGTGDLGSEIKLSIDGVEQAGPIIVQADGTWTFDPTPDLANGAVITAKAVNTLGSESGVATIVVDAQPPATPTVNDSNGVDFSGTAEAGATVILTDSVLGELGTVVAAADGKWSFTQTPGLDHDSVVSVVAKDAAGNSSGPASVTVDAEAPALPTIDPSNGVTVTGTAEPNATVLISNGAGVQIGQVTADGTGKWTFTPNPKLDHDAEINVVAKDAAGNTSDVATATVDAQAPAVPVLNLSDGKTISGTAEAGATVLLTTGSGAVIGEATADSNGDWSFDPSPDLANGVVINARAKDAAGNTSGPAATTVDNIAPDNPVVQPSTGVSIIGTAEPGAKVFISIGGAPEIQVQADASGNWSYTPGSPIVHDTVVTARAEDSTGNSSGTTSITVDSEAPDAPVINPSTGAIITGTGEIGALINLTDGNGNPIGEATVGADGTWTVTPASPLAHNTQVIATATDATGNVSDPATMVVDKVAPNAPVLVLNHDGNLLTGTAEPNSKLHLVIDGDEGNPIIVTVGADGTFSQPIDPALVAGESIRGIAVDATGNASAPTTIYALDLAPPTVTVTEAADGYVNAVEISNGIQVTVGLRPTMQDGQVVTVTFAGQNGYEQSVTYTLTREDIDAGSISITLEPDSGSAAYPEGAATITADISGGTSSTPVNFVVDTIPPAAPVLTLVGNLLTVTSEPFTKVLVEVALAGVTATVEVITDSQGEALIDLLTDLDIDLSWDQLLTASVSARGEDLAGNQGNIATIGVGPNLPQPVTVGDFGLDVALLPPTLGLSGTATAGSSIRVEVITPAANVFVDPNVDANGNFSVNLLDPDLLSDLGLSISGILNLGSNLSLNIVATDSFGNDSASYGVNLLGSGALLSLGEISVTGTSGNDFLTARNDSSERIIGADGHDLIKNVGSGDRVEAGAGNDTIEVTSANFTSIDGGAGFDTLLLAGGINLDYNAVGVGTLANIERINLGKGDSGSVLTLTAAEVGIITDSNNTLQITGEANDTLRVTGATNTGTTQEINGVTYDVYTFGSNTLLVEDNTVQVLV
ncbi:Ig-like domain-containing protein [Ectopseudomonas mendocina]|uniref:Ig-like domain-containing protein n=1 Tax=Ectopseudomonas mendocina TaxID=300 RepID=A0ABZ2RM11_ECTME